MGGLEAFEIDAMAEGMAQVEFPAIGPNVTMEGCVGDGGGNDFLGEKSRLVGVEVGLERFNFRLEGKVGETLRELPRIRDEEAEDGRFNSIGCLDGDGLVMA